MSAPLRNASAPAYPDLPRTLEGFEGIRRHWSPAHKRYIASIGPGEYFVSTGSELISTVLGSCVSACVRDVRRNLGGINHFMLPIDGSATNPRNDGCLSWAMRYGNYAMEHLLNEFYSRGSRRMDLEIKLFGGGQVMASNLRIGEKNIALAHKFFSDEGYVIEREDLGGYSGRKLLYDPGCGRALIKRTHSTEEQELVRREQTYIDSMNTGVAVGALELF